MATTAVTDESIFHHMILAARVESIFPTLATITVFIRIYLRETCSSTKRFRLEVDDYLIAFSLLFAWGFWATWYYACANFIGNDLYKIYQPPYLHVHKVAHIEVALIFVHQYGLAVIKTAIVFFYLRAFGTTRRARAWIYAQFSLIGVLFIIMNVLLISSCIPFNKVWNTADVFYGIHDCRSFKDLLLALQVLSWMNEVIILLFPIPFLWSLSFSTRKKLGIYAIFLLGALTCFASGANFYFILTSYKNIFTPSFVTPKRLICNNAEMAFGIIAASIPAIRQPAWTLLQRSKNRLFPRMASGSEDFAQASPQARVIHQDFATKGSWSDTTTVTITSLSECSV